MIKRLEAITGTPEDVIAYLTGRDIGTYLLVRIDEAGEGVTPGTEQTPEEAERRIAERFGQEPFRDLRLGEDL